MSTQPLNIAALVDLEYARDIRELKEEFAQVNPRDHKSLRDWFNTHPYLTVHDMSRIGDVCHKTVYTWRKRAGWRPPQMRRADGTYRRMAPPPRPVPKRAPTPKAPHNWDTDWLIQKYQDGYSIPQLARATHRSETTILKRLRRRITLRGNKDSVRTDHGCCTLSWVFEHYVQKKLSKARCAKLAGVSRYTFSVWLDLFKIRARSSSEQLLAQHGTDLGKINCPKAPRQ